MIRVISLLFFLVNIFSLQAQESKIIADKLEKPFFSDQVLEPVSGWSSDFGFSAVSIPVYPKSVYELRINNLETDIPLEYNDFVLPFIQHYAVNRREVTERALSMATVYFPMFEAIFEEAGLPKALKYLAVAESTLDPVIESSAEAVGLWQFISGTADMYQLKQDFYIDERRNPIKATKAAARHLQDLYDIYNDWYLVFAAYNCGVGNVNKAIRRSGNKKNYWTIRRYLPAETRGYVTSFIAACYVMNYAEEHNLHPFTPIDLPKSVDTINVQGPLVLKVVSEQLDISLDLLKLLNPEYKHAFIPDDAETHQLLLPSNSSNNYALNQKIIVSESKKQSGFYSRKKLAEAQEKINNVEIPAGKTSLIYTVIANDNLANIALLFDCEINEIKNWNALYGSDLEIGQKLKIYVPEDQLAHYQDISKTRKSIGSGESQIYYTVKKGDNLQSIAKQFPKMTVNQLKKINNIKNNSQLYPGKKLKVIGG